MLFFAHGPTATGKSSKLEAIRGVLGDYAATADFETFLKRHGDAGIRNDVARLAGARLVISVEVDDGKALAEGLLKLLTGGDTVAARFLYRETFEFRPVFKLWLAANDRPRVNADDAAMWRRILQLPFVNVIPEAERDERVKLALRNDPAVQTAILAWAVRGCLEWQTARPRRPRRRPRLHRRLPRRKDPLRDWLADCTKVDPAAWTTTADAARELREWCQSNGEKPVTAKKLGTLLDAKGYPYEKSGGTRGRQESVSTDPACTHWTQWTRDSTSPPRTPRIGTFHETHVQRVNASNATRTTTNSARVLSCLLNRSCSPDPRVRWAHDSGRSRTARRSRGRTAAQGACAGHGGHAR